MRRPAAWSPHRRRPCPSSSAASGTGTTATPGCGTPRSRCGRCSGSDSSTRPLPSPAGCATASPRAPAARATDRRSTSCTGSTGPRTSWRSRSTTGPATATPARCGSGTARPSSSSSTSTARRSTASTPATRPVLEPGHAGWTGVVSILDWVSENWDQPEEGIWETRGGRQDFTYGRAMCWIALDRGIRLAVKHGRPAPLERWTKARDAIYAQIFDRGWNARRGAFVQHYATDVLDSSLLRAASLGLMAPQDPMWLSTLDAMRDELVTDSLVYRYDPGASPDGLRGSEGTFSLCTFSWVDALARSGRLEEARADLREDADLRQPRRPVLGGARRHRGADRQLPAGVHAPRPHRRRAHPRRRSRSSPRYSYRLSWPSAWRRRPRRSTSVRPPTGTGHPKSRWPGAGPDERGPGVRPGARRAPSSG